MTGKIQMDMCTPTRASINKYPQRLSPEYLTSAHNYNWFTYQLVLLAAKER